MSEPNDSVETGQDMGGTTNAEAAAVHKTTNAEAWWADCFPQWKGKADNDNQAQA